MTLKLALVVVCAAYLISFPSCRFVDFLAYISDFNPLAVIPLPTLFSNIIPFTC